MSPIATDTPAKPIELASALSSDQTSCPVRPSSILRTPVRHAELAAPVQWQHVPIPVLTSMALPDTKMTLGASSSFTRPSQLASWTRPTVGVDQMSVKLGFTCALGPHSHLGTAL